MVDIVGLWNKHKNTDKIAQELGIAPRTVRHKIDKLYKKGVILEGYRYTNKQFKTEYAERPKYPSHELPNSEKQLNLTLENGTIVVFSDAHVHPSKPLSVAAQALIKVCKELKPDMVIDGGDSFDFSSISRHDKIGWNPEFTVQQELEAGVEFLDMVRESTPKSQFYMLASNHNIRFNSFLRKHAPQFMGVKGMNFEDHVKNWTHCLSIMLNKNTMFLHGWHSGVHATYQNTLKSGINLISSHLHQMDCKPYADYTGTRYGVCTGTLADKSSDFFRYTNSTPLNWVSGFVVLTYINHELQMPEFANVNNHGKVFFRGKIIE